MWIGIDEVGRGAWAGPLVVAGCYFIENPGFINGLDDSKKLSRKRREALEPYIKSSTVFSIEIVPAEEIDSIGLTAALRKAMLNILKIMPQDAPIMLDGKFNFLKNTPYEKRVTVEVKADGRYPSVMAASVIAKLERDRIMRDYDNEFPEYGFGSNVGYGTLNHRQSIEQYGVCAIHRKSIKPLRKIS